MSSRSVLVVLLLLVVAGPAWAACTPGTDCYCDKVTGGSLNDPNLLVCEDWEKVVTTDTGVGNGAPRYGPPYDDTGQSTNRGRNTYLAQHYGNGVDGSLWSINTPPNPPTVGHTCGFSRCSGTGLWHLTDLWQANSFAQVAILRAGEFTSEGSAPTNTNSGTAGVFEGSQSLGRRVQAGLNNTAGWGLSKAFSTTRTFSVTMAQAYSSNTTASGVWAQAWKSNEFQFVGGGSGGDELVTGHNQAGRGSTDPFAYQFIFSRTSAGLSGGQTQAQCQALLAAATISAGTWFCDNGGNFNFGADSSYVQSRDWPDNTWGCVQASFQNMGTSNTSITHWLTGPSGTRQVIDQITGLDTTLTSARDGYNGYFWDSYVNTNQGGVGIIPTTQITFRYEDNIHVTASATPITCAQIGFTGASSSNTLTISKSSITFGTGTATSGPAGINCGATCASAFTTGTVVTLSAAADSGSTFTSWSGGGCSGTGSCVVTLNSDTTVTATFTGTAPPAPTPPSVSGGSIVWGAEYYPRKER